MELLDQHYENQTRKNHDFSEADFSGKTMIDCTFEGCNLTLTKVINASLQKVIFSRCKLVGLDFSKVNDFNLELRFIDCALSNCIFTGLELEGTNFSQSNLSECYFANTNLRKANFEQTDLAGTTFDRVDLTGASFLGAVNYSINPLNNKLKKATFSYPEVIALLKTFDIEIK